jgi:hypothetical protein
VASTCCSIFLCERNKDYSGNVFGVYPLGCLVENVDKERIAQKADFLSFRSHASLVEAIPGVPEMWIEPDGSFNGSEGWGEAVQAAVGANAALISEGAKGQSLKELVEITGSTIKV